LRLQDAMRQMLALAQQGAVGGPEGEAAFEASAMCCKVGYGAHVCAAR
jgi:hypothetical protein